MPKNEVEYRRDTERKQLFLEFLASSSNVAASARAAKIALSTLYLWRNSDPVFYQEWMDALTSGYELLEMELLQRAREGVERKIFYSGEVVAIVREYDNRMALQLLKLHKDMVAQARIAQSINEEEADETYDLLDQKISDMRERMIRRGAFDGDSINHKPVLPGADGHRE